MLLQTVLSLTSSSGTNLPAHGASLGRSLARLGQSRTHCLPREMVPVPLGYPGHSLVELVASLGVLLPLVLSSPVVLPALDGLPQPSVSTLAVTLEVPLPAHLIPVFLFPQTWAFAQGLGSVTGQHLHLTALLLLPAGF